MKNKIIICNSVNHFYKDGLCKLTKILYRISNQSFLDNIKNFDVIKKDIEKRGCCMMSDVSKHESQFLY